MIRVPLAGPEAVGSNVTVTMQVPPAPIPVPQVLIWLKLLGETAKLEKVKAAVPESVMVTDCGVLATFSPFENVRVLFASVVPVMVTAGVPEAEVVLPLVPQPANIVKLATTARTSITVVLDSLLGSNGATELVPLSPDSRLRILVKIIAPPRA
jgi:hypothetical protein